MTDPRSDITSKLGTSGWHIALERATADKPYLGDVETVGQIVRAFIGGICDRYAEVCDGISVGPLAAQADRAECERLGKVFAGEDPAYQVLGPWNGQACADFAVATMPDHVPAGGAPAETMAHVFAVLALHVYQVLTDDADEEMARDRLNGAAEDWTHLLLGLPAVDGGEPDAPPP